MNTFGILTGIVLGSVFVVTFVNQFEHTAVGKLLERWNRVGLWPNWTLFVRPPADLRLWVQEPPAGSVDGKLVDQQGWSRISYGTQRRWYNLFWNPALRSGFWLFYAVREQTGFAIAARRSAWSMLTEMRTSVGHQALCNYIARRSGPPGERRFAIVFGDVEIATAGAKKIYQSPTLQAEETSTS